MINEDNDELSANSESSKMNVETDDGLTEFEVDHEAFQDDSPDEIILYRKRWLVLYIFSITAMLTSIYQYTFPGIAEVTLKYFRMNEHASWKVNMMIQTYNFNVVFALLANLLLSKLGLGTATFIGLVGHLVGGWVRFGFGLIQAEWAFWMVFVGQCICAAVQPTISYSITTLAANWFGSNERTFATTVATFTNILGTAFSFGLGTIVNPETGQRMPIVFLIHAILATKMFLLGIIFFRSRPPTPPSYSTMKQEKISYLKDYLELLKNIHFWNLGIVYGLGFGIVSTILSIINQIMRPSGYESIDSSIIGVIIIVSGAVGAIILGIIADRTKAFIKLMWVCGFGSIISLGGFTVALQFQKAPLPHAGVIISCIGLGGFSVAFVPLVLELACDITYPATAGASNLTLGIAGTITCAAFIPMFTALEHGKNKSLTHALYLAIGLFCFAMIVFSFFSGKQKRSLSDKVIETNIDDTEQKSYGSIQE